MRKTNHEFLRELDQFEMAVAINNIADKACEICPRGQEERCNEDCDNGLTEWMAKEYCESDSAWEGIPGDRRLKKGEK